MFRGVYAPMQVIFSFFFFCLSHSTFLALAYKHRAMPHTRDKTKRLVGFYALPGEKERLQEIADERGITLSELLRRIAAGDLIVEEPTKSGKTPTGPASRKDKSK